MIRALALAWALSGCGHLVRVDAGPTWIEGDGIGGTVQATAGLAIIAGTGIYDALVIGGFGTYTPRGAHFGLLFGCEVGVAPGGFDQPKGDTHREGTGIAGHFHPRVTADGVALGGGLGLLVASGERGDAHSLSYGSHEKFAGSIRWYDWDYWGVSVGLEGSRRLNTDAEPAPPWRADALVGVEWLRVTD